jgi:hypothetical protein
MSSEFSLLRVSPADFEDIDAFLVDWDRNYQGENANTFDLDGGMVEVLHFLLTGSSDTAGTWFTDSTLLVSEVLVPEYGDVLLIDALAGGNRLKSLHSQGLVACYLAPIQVQKVAEGLAKIAQENLEQRWNALNQLARAERRRVVGSLEKLQPRSQSLQEVVGDVRGFTEYFVNEFAAYYTDAAQNDLGVVVLDCT